MQKQMKQLSLADGLVNGGNSFLRAADALIDWSGLENELDGIYGSDTGRPSYPLLVMFKTLILQQWYGLSDPGMEEALSDRISFRRFAGLSLSDAIPDHSTISRFRSRLGDRLERLMSSLNGQFEQSGFIVKRGTMMDASFIKAASARNGVDPEAGRYGRHPDKSVTGYKAHVGTDQDSGIVRRVIVTPANVNDTVVADDLIIGDEGAVYADKAYDKKERRERLSERGVFVGIMHRPNPGRPLTEAQVLFNKQLTKIRAAVERGFAVLKLHYRLRVTRYIGLMRVTTQVTLAVMAMNIKRALVLSKT